MTVPSTPAARARREWAWAVILCVCALGSRLWFVTAYPTEPVSDFLNIVRFAEAFVRDGLVTDFAGWQFFSVGVPLALSFVMRLFPADPPLVARYATAVVTALSSLCPFVIGRGAFSLRARVAASLLLGLWPGHVWFSGVVAQDNWVLLPGVALATLAARVLATGEPARPVAALLLWAWAAVTRSEMLVAVAPLGLAAATGLRVPRAQWRRLVVGALAAGTVLSAASALRWAGSGTFGLSSPHGGLALLGAYSPGASTSYWTFPQAAAAATAPHLVHDWEKLRAEALGLGIREARRRPGYHAIRIFSSIVNCQLRSDAAALGWTMESLPDAPRARAARWAPRARLAAVFATAALFTAFTVVIVLAARGRAWPLLIIASAMILKVLVHGLIVMQPRYLVVVTAWALLGVGLATEGWGRTVLRGDVGRAALLGIAAASVLGWAGRRAEAYVLRGEEQRTYRFELREPGGSARLFCVIDEGLLAYIKKWEATIRPLHLEPAAGDSVVATCRAEALQGTAPVTLELEDAYARGGAANRVVQSVTLDGQEVLRHDLAAQPGVGWRTVPLGALVPGRPKTVVLRVQAVQPDPGWAWGVAAATRFRLAAAP